MILLSDYHNNFIYYQYLPDLSCVTICLLICVRVVCVLMTLAIYSRILV